MTTSVINLGQLNEVVLRDVWSTEDSDFTPWLADENNIGLLSSAIGIDLEVEAQEKHVGPYRADILCKDTASGSWVLIENQLEPTDHIHLGQLMTYAAGLNAVTVVWISSKFTDGHRAAMDWPNEITPEEFRFFGIELELWRIGNSDPAPKFNVVSRPNDWTGRSRFTPDISPTSQLQLEYWTALREVMVESGGTVSPTTPRPSSWQNFSIGRTNFALRAAIGVRDGWIAIRLVLLGDEAKQHYGLLFQDREEIEEQAGEKFEWRELPDNKESQINLQAKRNPAARDTWPEQHQWLLKNLNLFHDHFSERIKNLSADDFIPEN